ncbi:O-linked N-acetylglucosamine transferase, SPINDLY family protein [Limnofasciculus baicalensis]|uniref:protein O-GlcNAc transferase n=1 Tax=Limnofasciculus baicalensis BBK-W-15 TaxID=2699891 RepID=A0AAE3GXU4_9CYAN|nr:glycosyltransferase family 41 protein [Limnofasciculus baicalensis]MCP2732454.1 tetratricopeptide repeat protein [Limnofasciculus baicalensis BBK-W-15]
MSESQKLVQQGIQYLESGKLPDAETCFRQFIQTNSDNPDAWHLLGIVSAQKKEYSQAIEQIMRAIQLNPKEALFYNNLANVYQDKGDIEAAISAFTHALELAPQSWDIYYNLGILFGIKNDFDSAIKFLETFVKAQPHHVEGHTNLGVAYGKKGETEKGIAAFEKALALNPNQVNTLNNLGNAYIEYGELEKAILSCQKAIELEPNYAEAHYHLALALQKQDRLTEAVKSYQKALEIQSNYPNALNNLGNVFSSQGRFSEAIESYQKALEIEPKLRNTLYTLGNVFLSQGRTNEVIQSYQGAFNIDPQFIIARSNYVFSLNYSDSHQPETIYQEHQKWAELYETPLAKLIPQHPNVPNPEKKIRLGYVSGDFKTHSVAFFIESILANHNHQKFEIICYSNTNQRDRVTTRLKALADGWRQIETMGDEKVAELIQQDEIDILVDLSGHSKDNRLLVFARKPAPIQVTYLGYPNTTGLKNIDYRLTDGYTDPLGETDHLYSETLIRLPHGFLCYTPPQRYSRCEPTALFN